MLVYRKLSSGEILDSWVLKAINEVINFYGQGEVMLDKKGNFLQQYLAGVIGQAQNFQVLESQKKIYILSAGKIWEVDLK